MGQGDWREVIGHDGYFVVRLRLFTVEEGGQRRHIQSGLRAAWTASGVPQLLAGPLMLADDSQRSVAPGAEATVHVHPMQPSAWIDVEPGTRLGMCRNGRRELGEGTVIERVRVPREFVPLRIVHPPKGTPAVALHRPLTLAERIGSRFGR